MERSTVIWPEAFTTWQFNTGILESTNKLSNVTKRR